MFDVVDLFECLECCEECEYYGYCGGDEVEEGNFGYGLCVLIGDVDGWE